MECKDMAVCKTCGKENKGLPADWDNWECGQCDRDLYRTYAYAEGDKAFFQWRLKRRGIPMTPIGSNYG
jgi:hypothetical protein